ncbi:MAG: tyrosine protein kinase [Bacteroidaceae bacterium]|nr:tyrosine protein kinase [Bacteroidaceae bacterium]
MKLILNPHYANLRSALDNLDEAFAEGTSLREKRNSIRVCRLGGLELNVKRYHAPRPLQAAIYTFLRKPKGLRAYEHAALIAAAGVETPEAVAYVERRSGGLLAESFFISLQCPYTRRFYEFGGRAVDNEVRDVATAFARMTAHLHEARLLHLDYSPGNILFDRDADGQWHFSLVDTNRLRRGHVSIARGCANFARLWGDTVFFSVMADAYAEARGADADMCRRLMLDARRRFWTRYVRRHGEPFPLGNL